MVIITFIILFCICIWILYKKYYDIDIEVYKLNSLYNNTEVAPRSIASTKIKGNLDTIKQNNDYSRYLQYRTPFKELHHRKYDSIIDAIVKDKNLEPPDNRLFRINSTPQRILTHFDATDRYLIMLEGYKDVLLFRIDDYTPHEQVSLLHELKDFDIEGIKTKLDSIKVPFTQKRLTPGDVLHIPPGLYHYVENKELGGYTTSLNFEYNKKYNHWGALWDKMWSNAKWY